MDFYCKKVPPTREFADKILKYWLKKNKDSGLFELLSDDYDTETYSIFGSVFGISNEKYDSVVVQSALGWPVDHKTMTNDSETVFEKLYFSGFGGLWAWSPSYPDINCEVAWEECVDGVELPPRTIASLNLATLTQILECIEDGGKDWVAYEGYPRWFDLISLDTNEVVSITDELTELLTGNILEVLKEKAGYTESRLVDEFPALKGKINDLDENLSIYNLRIKLFLLEKTGVIKRNDFREKVSSDSCNSEN